LVQYNKANGKGNGCVFTVHDFAGIKWSVDTAIEFHKDEAAYALLRCNAWDSVIDLEEVCFQLLILDCLVSTDFRSPPSRCAAPIRKSESGHMRVSAVIVSCFNRMSRFHRLRYKLSPVGAHEVTLGELQQIVMPEQATPTVGSVSTLNAIPAIPSDLDSANSSTILFKAP
jgi:hypothetical protein